MGVLRSIKEEKLCQNLATGMFADAAHTAAGYKPSTQNAWKKCRQPRIVKRVGELTAPALAANQVTVDRVLKEFTRLAFYDMTQVLEVADGKIVMRDPASLPEDLRLAIVGIKPVQWGDQLLYECRFADKQKALDSLARHLQMFKDMVIVENVFRIVNEMEDDELDRRLTELERAFREATTLDPPSGEGPASLH